MPFPDGVNGRCGNTPPTAASSGRVFAFEWQRDQDVLDTTDARLLVFPHGAWRHIRGFQRDAALDGVPGTPADIRAALR